MSNIKNEKIYKINQMILKELEEANKKHPQFNSRHEAYAILKEEFEELFEEIEDVKNGINNNYWKYCRKSKYYEYGNKEIIKLLKHLEVGIKWAILELLQVGAMVLKSKDMELLKKGEID